MEVSWQAPLVDTAGGDAATGYVVYRAMNGYAFGQPVTVSGGATTSIILSDLMPGDSWYFQVAATNDGGESLPSETNDVRVREASSSVLVVNGYDRADRFISPTRFFANNLNGNVTLVRPLSINGYDYVVQHGHAIAAADRYFDTASNESLIDGNISLTSYRCAAWMLGRESTVNETFDKTEQTLVETYIAGGGSLFLSGAEIAWDLDHQGSAADQSFHATSLRALYAQDDAGTHTAIGASGSVFDGVGSLTFDDGNGPIYNVKFPDVLLANAGWIPVLRYNNNPVSGSVAGIQYDGLYRLIYLGFPFETILSSAQRDDVMILAMDFLDPATGGSTVMITEIMQNPQGVSDTKGEWFEIFNPGSIAVDIDGWVIQDDGSNIHTINFGGPLLVPPGGFLVLGREADRGLNGGVSIDYVYSNFTLSNGADEVVLLDGGMEVARVNYTGVPSWPDPSGASMELLDVNSDPTDPLNWGEALTAWNGTTSDYGSPGEPPAFNQQRIVTWDPITSILWTAGLIEICVDAGGTPVTIWWTDDLTTWPVVNTTSFTSGCWTNPSSQTRFYRVTVPVPSCASCAIHSGWAGCRRPALPATTRRGPAPPPRLRRRLRWDSGTPSEARPSAERSLQARWWLPSAGGRVPPGIRLP